MGSGALSSFAVCVYCSSSEAAGAHNLQLAQAVGTGLAQRGWTLVSGGGRVSMMGAVASAARAEGARTVGVIPRALVEHEVADLEADELLVTDSAYEPTRTFSTEGLSRFGVTTRFYDPRIGAGIAELFTDRTRAIFVESPGSLTFEMQDLPAIAAAARERDITVIVDNSWATPLFHRPLEHGADLHRRGLGAQHDPGVR